jgi:hypothetical protein
MLSRINVYMFMLLISFVALCIACGLLSIELGRYKWDTKASTAGKMSSIISPAMSRVADLS